MDYRGCQSAGVSSRLPYSLDKLFQHTPAGSEITVAYDTHNVAMNEVGAVFSIPNNWWITAPPI